MFVFAEASNVASAGESKLAAAAMMATGVRFNISLEFKVPNNYNMGLLYRKNSLKRVEFVIDKDRTQTNVYWVKSDRRCPKKEEQEQ